MKLLPSVLIVVAISLVGMAGKTSAQSGVITEKEFWAGTYSAYSTSRKIFPRRETDKYEKFKDGALTYSRIKISEYHTADMYRITTETLTDGKKSLKEMIREGGVNYCRENDGDWKTSGCYLNPPGPLENATDSSFSLQKGNGSSTYSRTASYLEKESGIADPSKFKTDDKLILNGDLSVRERSIVHSEYETKKIRIRETKKYEYGLTLKPLEAPLNVRASR